MINSKLCVEIIKVNLFDAAHLSVEFFINWFRFSRAETEQRPSYDREQSFSSENKLFRHLIQGDC